MCNFTDFFAINTSVFDTKTRETPEKYETPSPQNGSRHDDDPFWPTYAKKSACVQLLVLVKSPKVRALGTLLKLKQEIGIVFRE